MTFSELPSTELRIINVEDLVKDDPISFTTIAIIVLGALVALAGLVFIIVKVSRYYSYDGVLARCSILGLFLLQHLSLLLPV